MTIDVERIKEYNKKYKESQSKVANLQAELDMNNREIDRLCKELSAELGISITRENVEQVYMQKVQEINNNLELGENILKRIESEEKGLKESSELEGELKVNNPNMSGNTGMNGNASMGNNVGMGGMPQMNPMGNMGSMSGFGNAGNTGNAGNAGNAGMGSMGGFDTLGGMPQMEIKADEQPVSQASGVGGVKNPFINQAMGSPVIPQMFSRNGGDVPSLNESDFDSI